MLTHGPRSASDVWASDVPKARPSGEYFSAIVPKRLLADHMPSAKSSKNVGGREFPLQNFVDQVVHNHSFAGGDLRECVEYTRLQENGETRASEKKLSLDCPGELAVGQGRDIGIIDIGVVAANCFAAMSTSTAL
jgi:hypothetical protein